MTIVRIVSSDYCQNSLLMRTCLLLYVADIMCLHGDAILDASSLKMLADAYWGTLSDFLSISSQASLPFFSCCHPTTTYFAHYLRINCSPLMELWFWYRKIKNIYFQTDEIEYETSMLHLSYKYKIHVCEDRKCLIIKKYTSH